MATNALVQVRINGQIKAEAAAILAKIDLTASEAVRPHAHPGCQRQGFAL